MKTSDLLLSSLNITEDEYSYKGLFILSDNKNTLQMEMADLDNDIKIADLKEIFVLEENLSEIKKILMDTIFENANISSKIIEGEDYEENSKKKRIERFANSMDMA